jgi:hypothetical protein
MARNRDWVGESFFDEPVEAGTLPELNIAEVDSIGFGGLSLPIIRTADGKVHLGDRFVISYTGIVISDSVTESEFWSFFDTLDRLKDAIQWILGDLAVHGEDHFSKTYDDISQRTGYKPETIENYAYVARNVSQSLRNDSVSFNHHYLVAGLETDDAKREWLGYAAEKKLSVRNLELALNIWKEGGDPDIVLDFTEDKPSVVQQAEMKMERERISILKKAKKKPETWVTFAERQAEKWAKLAEDIKSLDKQ